MQFILRRCLQSACITCLTIALSFSPTISTAQDENPIFAPGIISNDGVLGLTLSPDGQHALWVKSDGKREALAIMESFKKHGQWQTPQVVSFSSSPAWKDIDPMFSPDGKTLIFQSTRPVPNKPARTGFDIWAVRWQGNHWGDAYHLGNVINTDVSESSASIASNGNIYFHKVNSDGVHDSDLFVSRWHNNAYQEPENLGAMINTKERESNPYIAPDESYLIYFSSDPGGLGWIDLVISFFENGQWSTPVNLGMPINTKDAEFCPFVHQGRLYLSRQKKGDGRFIENIYSYPFSAENYRKK